MNLLDRFDRLESLFLAANGQIESKDKLHKLVYLCQVAGDDLGQDFTFFFTGVLSPSLDFELDRAIARGVVYKENPTGYMVTLKFSDHLLNEKINGPGFITVNRLASEPIQVLELLTMIIYLSQVGYSKTRISEKLRELKGHSLLRFEKSAWQLAQEHFDINFGGITK